MDLAARIHQQFALCSETYARVMPNLVDPLVRAAEMLVGSLLEGGRVLCCANGASAATAKHFTSMMINGLERERPGLPAMTLSADAPVLTGTATRDGFNAVYARQVSALGHPGDVLLVIAGCSSDANLLSAVSTARERQMKIIALTGGDAGGIAQLLQPADVELRVALDSRPRVHELHLLIVHCLSDLIDAQLLGA